MCEANMSSLVWLNEVDLELSNDDLQHITDLGLQQWSTSAYISHILKYWPKQQS